MTTYYMSTQQAKAMCDLYVKLGGGLMKQTGTDSAGTATTEFAGTDLARAFSAFTVNPLGVTSSLVSLRQLSDGDVVSLELDFCKPCDQSIARCIGILNSIFENPFIVPNTQSPDNTEGAQFSVVIKKPTSTADTCLCC